MRAEIERELGPIGSPDPVGHDGQIYYMIARDPFATRATVDALLTFDVPTYRYRRILFPLLAGGFGQFSPKVTLFGMFLWAVIGMALATVGIADIGFTLRAASASVILAAVNIGAMVSVMLLTVDALALGLSLLGIALLLRRRSGWALVVLTLAALAKETYVLVPFGLAIWQWVERRRRAAVALVVVPALPLACWTLWVWLVIPEVERPTSIIGFSLRAIGQSVSSWLVGGRAEGIQSIFAVYVGIAFASCVGRLWTGRAMLRWLVVPWLALACFAGADVWGIPTNVARAFSILWPLGIILLFDRQRSSRVGSPAT